MQRHLNFIIKAPLTLDLFDCFISHAGISTYYSRKLGKYPLENREKMTNIVESDLNNEHGVLWTRDKLLNLNKLQIVGHTRFEDIYYDKSSHAVYVDTAACSGNRLSAVIVNESNIVDKISVPTDPKDIN
jgi:serine/threonine protein phosphatase 1